MVCLDDESVFGESSKITLCVLIPRHACSWMLPPAFHVLQGAFVRLITTFDHVSQMPIFRLYDLIGGISTEPKITWPARLFTRHSFHSHTTFLF